MMQFENTTYHYEGKCF